MGRIATGLLVGAGALWFWHGVAVTGSPASLSIPAVPASAEKPRQAGAALREAPAIDPRQSALEIERALLSRDAQRQETALHLLLPELLAADPGYAVDMLAHLDPGEPREMLIEQLARRWVIQDREAASGWLETLPDAERKAAAMLAVRALAAGSPEQAIATADRFGVGRDDGSLEHLVQVWAAADFAAASRWLDRQPADERSRALRVRIEQARAVSGV